MFSKENQKKSRLDSLSIDELVKQLNDAKKMVEMQELSIETSGGRGIIPPQVSDRILVFYKDNVLAIEEELKKRSHRDFNSGVKLK